MKKLKLIIPLFLFVSSFLFGQEFTRELPKEDLIKQLTPEKFPNSDAIIILKEQSFYETGGEFFYYGVDIPTRNTVYTKIMIVKMLNESAVKRYGNFEYEYHEPFGNEIKNGFTASVRVMKPNGDVLVMPKDDIKIIVTSQDKHGDPIKRKAMFNVPSLAPGDILQVEYQTLDIFSSSTAGIFSFNDEDITLFSNLYITLPDRGEYSFKSFPADKIGEPKIVQLGNNYGDGKTYFWSLRNLGGIPSQSFSKPFQDRSMIASFYETKKYIGDEGDWNSVGKRYFDKILDKKSLSSGQFELLGFRKDEKDITIKKIDSLYTSMRKYFTLEADSYIYPKLDDMGDVFDERKGDATDVAFIMYKALEKWGVKPKAVLIRDRRTGIYENEVPSLIWFNRIGILVEVDGKEKLYDFDRSLPSVPENPWYLNNVSMPVVDESICIHKNYTFNDKPENNISSEIHKLSITDKHEFKDSLEISYTGSFAQRMRSKLYSMDKNKATEFFRDKISSGIIPRPAAVQLNNYGDESKITVRTSGAPQFKSDVIDSIMTVNTNNVILSEFRDKLFTAKRSSDIYFDSPLCFILQYEIPIPAGFKIYNQPSNYSSAVQAGLNFTINYNVSADKIIITAREDISNPAISVKLYKDIMNHLDNSLKELGKDLMFVKTNNIKSL